MFAIFDCDEIVLHPIRADGKVDYDRTLPWPADWPQWIGSTFLDVHGIKWVQA